MDASKSPGKLLETVLEDIEDKIKSTLDKDTRHGSNLHSTIQDQIQVVKQQKEQGAEPEEILRQGKKLNALHLLYWNWKLSQAMTSLGQEEEDGEEVLPELMLACLMLGIYRANHFTLDGDEYFSFKDPLTHKKVSAEIVSSEHQKRDSTFKANIKQALSRAEAGWNNGSTMLHDQMAEKLLHEFPEIKENLPDTWNFKKKLMQELKPIARQYNRVRGDKKL